MKMNLYTVYTPVMISYNFNSMYKIYFVSFKSWNIIWHPKNLVINIFLRIWLLFAVPKGWHARWRVLFLWDTMLEVCHKTCQFACVSKIVSNSVTLFRDSSLIISHPSKNNVRTTAQYSFIAWRFWSLFPPCFKIAGWLIPGVRWHFNKEKKIILQLE